MATERQIPTPLTSSTPPDNAECQNCTYTINNEMHEPHLHATIELPITPGKRLIHYMKLACRMDPDRFSRFSVSYWPEIPGGAGFGVYSINSVKGCAQHKTYWKISNQGGALNVGVSLYVPRPMDQLVFNLTQYDSNQSPC